MVDSDFLGFFHSKDLKKSDIYAVGVQLYGSKMIDNLNPTK